jgi:hypothetical protein
MSKETCAWNGNAYGRPRGPLDEKGGRIPTSKILRFTEKAECQRRHSAFAYAQYHDRNQEIANFMPGSALDTGPSRLMRAPIASHSRCVLYGAATSPSASCGGFPPFVPNEKPPSSTLSSPPPRIWALPCPSHFLSVHRKASGLPAIEDPN